MDLLQPGLSEEEASEKQSIKCESQFRDKMHSVEKEETLLMDHNSVFVCVCVCVRVVGNWVQQFNINLINAFSVIVFLTGCHSDGLLG